MPSSTGNKLPSTIADSRVRALLLFGALLCVLTMGLIAFFLDFVGAYVLLGMFLSLFLGILGMPDGKSGEAPRRSTRIAIAVGILVVTWLSILWLWFLPGSAQQIHIDAVGECTHYGYEKWWANTSFCFLSAPLAALFVAKYHPPSDYARSAVWCAVSAWLMSVSIVIHDACFVFGAICPLLVDSSVKRYVADIDSLSSSSNSSWVTRLFFITCAFNGMLISVVICWIQYLVLGRLREYETALNKCLWTKQLRWLLIVCLALAFALASSVEVLITGLFSGLIWILILWGYSVPLRLLCSEAKYGHGVRQAEARWAARGLQRESAAIVICCLLWCCLLWGWADYVVCTVGGKFIVRDSACQPFVLQPWLCMATGLAEILTLGIFSGVLWQQSSPKSNWIPPPTQLHGTALSRTSLNNSENEKRLWDEKVAELAGRGVRVEALLDFMQILLEGSVMPSYDPRRSTTNDVVRQAIVPLSRDASLVGGGSALATFWNDGRALQPERMVTHNWSNRFVHLVAAVVADVLGVSCYKDVAAELSEIAGLNVLREQLRSQNVLHKTYWICAFSVNQHASICSSFGPVPAEGTQERIEWEAKTRDTVTGERYPLCNCHEKKLFNDDSTLCELNKFPDVMSFLFTRSEGFAQLVAVDDEFDVFSRAWCVAELVEADGLAMPQHVKIHSYKAFDDHYHRLATIDVRGCQASRQEDKAAILANIDDISAFNERLQWLIHGTEGLFRTWMDGRARAKAVGRIAARALMRIPDRASAQSLKEDLELGSGKSHQTGQESFNKDLETGHGESHQSNH